jgi:hypothetical protein
MTVKYTTLKATGKFVLRGVYVDSAEESAYNALLKLCRSMVESLV